MGQMSTVRVGFHQPWQEWVCRVAKYDNWNIFPCNLFLPVQKKTTILPSLVQAGVRKDTGIMHLTKPADIDISETASMVDSPLQDNGVPALTFIVISWTLMWRNDGNNLWDSSMAPAQWGKPRLFLNH